MKRAKERRVKARKKIHKDKAFRRGKIKSEEPNIIGKRIFPKPPIRIGMIMKKIMKIP
jgi:hypothetical protein